MESLIVSLAGGALGMFVAKWSNAYIARFFGLEMPLDLRVIGFTFLVSTATGAVFGTVPAWVASLTDVTTSLKAGARSITFERSRHWLRQGLVVLELGLALTLLAGAGFFVSGTFKLTHRDLGWSPDNLLVGSIELGHDQFGEADDPRSLEFGDRMRERLKSLPGVETAAISIGSPAFGYRGVPFRIEGEPSPEKGKETFTYENIVTPEFFETYGVHIIQGRGFLESDRPGAPHVAIINESMAKKFWPGENPIGKRIGTADPANPDWAEVVGVTADFQAAGEFFDRSATNIKLLRPWAQNNHRFIWFAVRTWGRPEASKEGVRKAMGLLAPNIALGDLSTIKEVMEREVSYFTFLRRLFLQVSALGLLLAIIGIYGVVANLTLERTREVGIRMALGAQPAGLVWLFLKDGLRLAVLGAIAGLAAAFVLMRVLSKMLPVVPGNDPRVVVGLAFLLMVVALVACWLPAHRTTKIDPTLALRAE
jgi:predicted permease